ncbi:MAG: hypothetical protein A3C90_02435 [Candidatus Magasanikbacteria bacterium RIFCSPHIGHO2_02_FULL_51_14]|uniref:Methyltransferase domain-containing protein n=1 Tax=Candidatus Magasanikbacteria bacterium RIFCSPHIGHO2_02_FULL_51_14 TaxID=1798683 RepID=A0A1F6ME38_9BACT|nr:MAG: hypothetical protein A3C90_02435 [Candidatus Magasanikbacteria bacterium RIFCSPHIGHO2_02_FULL_51_14]
MDRYPHADVGEARERTRPQAEAEMPQEMKDRISWELEDFTTERGIKSLQDRLRIGLNEAAFLGIEETSAMIKGICKRFAASEEEANELYEAVTKMTLDIQQFGPWDYAKQMAAPETAAAKIWHMLSAATTIGYEEEMDLNDEEFAKHTRRIESNLKRAASDANFFEEAYRHNVELARERIRFNPEDKAKRVPIGEGLKAFIPMAIAGYEAGVCHDAEGWVYVGARGEITDNILERLGLEKEDATDDRDPSRNVTFFKNEEKHRIIKKLHPGFLVILSKNFPLAEGIVRGLNDRNDILEVAQKALGHTRVVQTTEGKRKGEEDEEKEARKTFLKLSGLRAEMDLGKKAESTDMVRLKDVFYHQMLYIRGLYVYLDALDVLKREKRKEGREVTELDKELLSKKIWEKMKQKVDELQHVNGLLAKEIESLPPGVKSVVDMAGGAGDLGLAVTTELLANGRDVKRTEIVDPQEGTDEFMDTIIEYLPFRDKLQEIAAHNNGYLQDAHITPDSLVVAKHACGTLTDDVIDLWRASKSPALIAMTCCQDKAADHPARHGFSQKSWKRLCLESGGTSTQIPEEPGSARDKAMASLARGKKAMLQLDRARVEYLKRHGFKAELHTTDKFPKGDVIIARRLPRNFIKKLEELRMLGEKDPVQFKSIMSKINAMAQGGMKEARGKEYGGSWVDDDFAELRKRLTEEPGISVLEEVAEEEKRLEAEETERKKSQEGASEEKRREKEIIASVFSDIKGGRMDMYLRNRCEEAGRPTPHGTEFAKVMGAIKSKVIELKDREPATIRTAIDELVKEMISRF